MPPPRLDLPWKDGRTPLSRRFRRARKSVQGGRAHAVVDGGKFSEFMAVENAEMFCRAAKRQLAPKRRSQLAAGMRNRSQHDDSDGHQGDPAAAEGYGSAEVYGRDILAATLLTLAAIAFIGIAWKSSAPMDTARNATPATEVSQNAPDGAK